MKKYFILSCLAVVFLSSCTGIYNKESSGEEQNEVSTKTPLGTLRSLFSFSDDTKEVELMVASEIPSLSVPPTASGVLIESAGASLSQSEEIKAWEIKNFRNVWISSSGNTASWMNLITSNSWEILWSQSWALEEIEKNIIWEDFWEFATPIPKYREEIVVEDSLEMFPEDCYDEICIEEYMQSDTEVSALKDVTLWDLSTVSQTWGKNLNPAWTIPDSGVHITYFDTTTKQVLKKETRDTLKIIGIGIQENLPSPENLWVYAVWKIQILESGKYTFSLPSGWDNSRFILDKKLIFENGNEEITLFLEKGEYTYELEYICIWHVVDIVFSWKKQAEIYTQSDIQKIFSLEDSSKYDVWYAGAYESGEFQGKIYLDIQKNDIPVILVLSSYSPVEWVVRNPYNTQIKAILFTGYTPGSEVNTWNTSIPVYELWKYFFDDIVYEILPICYGEVGYYHCEWNIQQLDRLNDFIEAMFGKTLKGFSGGYNPDTLSLPEDILTETRYTEISQQQQKLFQDKEEANTPIDFENIFE